MLLLSAPLHNAAAAYLLLLKALSSAADAQCFLVLQLTPLAGFKHCCPFRAAPALPGQCCYSFVASTLLLPFGTATLEALLLLNAPLA
eukprot:scaffold117962_cov23-Tisochrysis_lutea.AAC.2